MLPKRQRAKGYLAFRTKKRLRTCRRSAAGYQTSDELDRGGPPLSDTARGHRQRQNIHDGPDHSTASDADTHNDAQQDAGGAALQRIQRLFPRQPCRVLHKLLRLLPARSLYTEAGSIHRKGQLHKRGARTPEAQRHCEPAHLRRRYRGRLRLRELRPRKPDRVQKDGPETRNRRRDRAANPPSAPRGDGLQKKRQLLRQGRLPPERRRCRHLPGIQRRRSAAGGVFRRRDRGDIYLRPSYQPEDFGPQNHHGLRGEQLHCRRRQAAACDKEHRGGARRKARLVQKRGEARRVPAAQTAHRVRPRDARDHRYLQRDRELRPPPYRQKAGRDPLFTSGLFRDQREALSRHSGRVARESSAVQGDVCGRQEQERGACRVRFQASERPRQPPSEIRRVHRESSALPLRLGHPGGARGRAQRRRGGADHPADGAPGPRGGGCRQQVPGGASIRRNKEGRGPQGEGARYGTYEKDGRRADHLLQRPRPESEVYALGDRRHRAEPDHKKPKNGRIRRACGYKPASGGARSSGSEPRGDTRC